MVIGLGSGSTAWFALERIGELVRSGSLTNILGVPTSKTVEAEARCLKIPLCPYDDPPAIDLTIDGADEVDGRLNLIKGGGGALVREKLVAQLSRREVIVVDESKVSDTLGTHSALPVEVIDFAWKAQSRFLEQLGGCVTMRMRPDGEPYRTDQGNLILDARLGPIDDLDKLAATLEERAGVVGHGLFLGLASEVIIAGAGGIRRLSRG
jgi:ribose 5-phosphate isomerase A